MHASFITLEECHWRSRASSTKFLVRPFTIEIIWECSPSLSNFSFPSLEGSSKVFAQLKLQNRHNITGSHVLEVKSWRFQAKKRWSTRSFCSGSWCSPFSCLELFWIAVYPNLFTFFSRLVFIQQHKWDETVTVRFLQSLFRSKIKNYTSSF